jgi:hypothetical protein
MDYKTSKYDRCPVGWSVDSRGDTLGMQGDRTCSQISALRLLIAVAKLRRQQKCRIMEAWTDRLIQGIKGNEPALHSILYPSLSVSRAL